MVTLDGFADELAELEARCAHAAEILDDPARDLPPGLRNDLSQCHGSANKLLATKVDAVVTGDLTSGRDDARAKRKKLVHATEAFIEEVERQIKKLDARKAARAQAPAEHARPDDVKLEQ